MDPLQLHLEQTLLDAQQVVTSKSLSVDLGIPLDKASEALKLFIKTTKQHFIYYHVSTSSEQIKLLRESSANFKAAHTVFAICPTRSDSTDLILCDVENLIAGRNPVQIAASVGCPDKP